MKKGFLLGEAFFFMLFYAGFLDFLSKNGFLEDALTRIAKTCLHPFNISKRCAPNPAENITRVSTLLSAAVAQAEPIAIPTSTLLITQGTPVERSAQVGKPQWPQFNP